MPAVKVNLVIEQGATFRKTWTLKDADGNPVDLTGYTARSQARPAVDSATTLWDLTSSPAAGMTVDGPGGSVTMEHTDEETAAFAWSRGVYDVEIESPTGDVARLSEGSVRVKPEVTR